MQYDPNKQGYNNYGNQYPPMNQPPYGAGNIYQPNNAPPPYTQYPQHSSAYPTAVYQPPTVTVIPLYRPLWNYLTPTPITSSLRVFFIISGLLYLIWGILAVGLEIGILIYSYWRYYTGFWTGFFLIAGGITMLVVGCQTSYVMSHVIRLLGLCLFFCILGLILSIVNVARSGRCDSIYSLYYCDNTMGYNLKVAILVFFIIANIHTIINMSVAGKAQRSTMSGSTPNVPIR